jgi:hypothetical protein
MVTIMNETVTIARGVVKRSLSNRKQREELVARLDRGLKLKAALAAKSRTITDEVMDAFKQARRGA